MVDAHTPCKVCNSASKYVGAVEFNKTCEDRNGSRVFPVSDVLCAYYACSNCGFIFTPDFDSWSAEDVAARIYNEEYFKADPDQIALVDTSQTVSYKKGIQLANMFPDRSISVLDFGSCGNPGHMGRSLIDNGFKVVSYDPYFYKTPIPDHRFDLIICIEVLEHCIDVVKDAKLISELLDDNGLLYLATLLHPFPTPERILDSWYISPRNGHVSIHTFWSLANLFRRFGINVVQTVYGLVGLKEKPRFDNHIFV